MNFGYNYFENLKTVKFVKKKINMQKGREIKPHIGIYGRRNFGKSSFINCITGQHTAIVSDVAGTKTDPEKKSYEITGFGPVILIDTAGIDDEGDLGKQRIQKTLDTVKLIDLAILIITKMNLAFLKNF